MMQKKKKKNGPYPKFPRNRTSKINYGDPFVIVVHSY